MGEEKIDLYKYEECVKKALARIDKDDRIIPENKKRIMEFYNFCLADGRGRAARLYKILQSMAVIARLVAKPFEDINKNDAIELIAKIESRDYSDSTKNDYRQMVKRFFRWLRGCEEGTWPEEVRWIKCRWAKNKLTANQLLTEDEISKMVSACSHPRDKALIFVLYESGCRISEILTLRIRDVQFDKIGAFLNVNGKTGTRRVRIVQSVPLLASWLNHHPFSQDESSPVWLKFAGSSIAANCLNRALPLGRDATCRLLERIAKKAGITKHVYPHLFRHSRATYLASHLTESLLKQHMGWTQSSDMAATYVHLSGQELDKAILKVSGVKVEQNEPETSLNVVTCPRCKNQNSATSRFCPSCGFCFDVKVSIQVDEVRSKIDDLFGAIVRDPQKLDLLLKVLQSAKD